MREEKNMKTKINVSLLLQVADAISKHPEHFNMQEWDCGTTACIGGWALRLSPVKPHWNYFTGGFHPAKELLRLTVRQNKELFGEIYWPARYRSKPTDTPEDRSKKAVRRIHRFLYKYAPGWRNMRTKLTSSTEADAAVRDLKEQG